MFGGFAKNVDKKPPAMGRRCGGLGVNLGPLAELGVIAIPFVRQLVLIYAG
jgi:hypothetical protein